MKSAVLKALDPISIMSFLQTFKMACHLGKIYARAAIGLHQQLMGSPVKATFAHHSCVKKDDDTRKEGNVSTFSQVESYLLAVNAADNMIAELEPETSNSKQPEHMSTNRYLDVLCEKALHYGRV